MLGPRLRGRHAVWEGLGDPTICTHRKQGCLEKRRKVFPG